MIALDNNRVIIITNKKLSVHYFDFEMWPGLSSSIRQLRK